MSMTGEITYTPRKGRRVTPIGDQTILANTPATISVMLRDQDGEAHAAGGTVTVGVVDSGGAAVVAPATSTTEATPLGMYTAALPAHAVDGLTATWTVSGTPVAVTSIEVVGDYYFSLGQLREMQSVDPDKYPTARLRSARRWAERLIDRVCETSFVLRYQSDVLSRGDFLYSSTALGTRVRFPDPFVRDIYGVALDGADFDQIADLTILDRGRAQAGTDATTALEGDWTGATLRYVSGFTDGCPDDLAIAALKAARYRLISTDGSSGIPSRALAVNGAPQIDRGRIDADHPTGIEEVDVVICGWRDRVKAELGW